MKKKLLSNYLLFFTGLGIFSFLFVFSFKSISLDNTIKLCSKLNYKESLYLHPKNFKKFDLNLKILNQRKWRRIAIEEELERKKVYEEEGRRYFYLNRERTKASFIVNIDNKIKCKILANIRIHGDLMDHRRGSGLPSLNVNITDGHIFGIVKFVLFRPSTRNYDNEIFTANLMRELGFLSPRTASVQVEYNNLNSKFIFQEKIVKEFLEHSNQREGALLEGDERFTSYDPYETINLSKHRLINKVWAKKNNVNLTLSETALSILNEINQYHRIIEPSTHQLEIVDYYSVAQKIGNEDYFKELPSFDAMMFVMEGEHNLARNNRRFYYDPVEKKFIPIYYDGLTNLLTQNNNILDLPLLDTKVIDKKDSQFRKGKVSPSAVKGSLNAYKTLNNFKIEIFKEKLSNYGLNLSDEKLNELIRIIKKRLMIISKFNEERIFNIVSDTKSSSFMPTNFTSNKNIKRRFLYYDEKFNEYLNCDIYGDNCLKTILNSKQKVQALAQELKDEKDNNLIYVGKKRKNLPNTGWYSHYIYKKKFTNRDIVENIYSDNSSIIKYGNINLDIDTENKIIKIDKVSQNGRIIFKGGKMKNWEIIFRNNLKQKKDNRIDENGFTGCVSLIDVEVINSSFELSNSDCEDSINFIRSYGSIKSLFINNSLYDAMDADFSYLKFENINIKNAKNDCLDFSYGNYDLNIVKVGHCGDKGISVGESSKVNIQNLFVKKSKVGVASKDYSNVKIIKGNVDIVDYCLAVYKKKQEFSGGYIFSNKFNCSNFSKKILRDNQSTLEVTFL